MKTPTCIQREHDLDLLDRMAVIQFIQDLAEPRVDRLRLLSLAEQWNRRDPYGRGTFGGDGDA